MLLRCNASLRYQYLGPRKEGRGRPKQYDGEVDFKNLDLSKVAPLEVEEGKAYTFVANVKAMKRFVRIVVWYNTDNSYKIFFSTDVDMSAKDIIDTYHSRFQIEFAFRYAIHRANGLSIPKEERTAKCLQLFTDSHQCSQTTNASKWLDLLHIKVQAFDDQPLSGPKIFFKMRS